MIVTAGLSFSLVEHDHARVSAEMYGAKLPSRSHISGPILNNLFNDTQLATYEKVDCMDYSAGASNAWRRKYCEQGSSLLNFTVMGQEGDHLCQTDV